MTPRATRATKLRTKALAIKPEPNKLHENVLDLLGNAFKFDHPKGLAEWLKNSADGYATANIRDADQFILLRFEIANPKSNSVFECIDFVGMTKKDIDDGLKVWFSPDAAKKGTKVATYGGHGNGGKFYMRQMFETSKLVTYRNNRLNIFGFDKAHKYGFVPQYTDTPMPLADALVLAGIDALAIPKAVQKRWKKYPRKAGFTVVKGDHPKKFKGRATIDVILKGLRYHPQARRLLAHKQIIVIANGDSWGARLESPSVQPKKGFEKPRTIRIPVRIKHNGETFKFGDKDTPAGVLTLRTSDEPLSRNTELSALNTVDVMGEVGCIGSYRMNELGFLRFGAESEFIYGECECPLLESPQVDAVSNDREKLVVNGTTTALLDWIRQQVDALAEEMAEKTKSEQKSRDLQQSSLFNQILDRWKNKFMATLTADLFGGPGAGVGFGGTGGGGGGGGTDGEGEGDGDGGNGHGGQGDGQGGGGDGNEKRHGNRFPIVLLSGYDRDPLDDEATGAFECDPRQPPIYQRFQDIEHGIYWINTSRPLAGKIIDRYTAQSPRWREYLFQRYIDIILKQTVYVKAKQDADFTPDKVDGLIDEVTSRVHDAAAGDLETFLFDETMKGVAASKPNGRANS